MDDPFPRGPVGVILRLAAPFVALLVFGCGAAPGADGPSGRSASPVVSVSPWSSPPSSAHATAGPVAVSVVDDPYRSAVDRVMELGGSSCVRERHVDLDVAGLRLDAEAAKLRTSEGMIASGRAYLGSVVAAAQAYGATELLERPGGGRAVAIGKAAAVQEVGDGAPIGLVLLPFQLQDGRIAWIRTGDYVAAVPCTNADGS